MPNDSLREIRERVIAANRGGTPLRLRGSGTKDFYGESLEGEILDLRGHSGIVEYEPSELVITARCGTPIAEIEKVLAASGQFLAFEPPSFATHAAARPTLGGAIAAGLSGPRRMHVGAARDFVLGAKLLNAQGEELRFGGRVMKNVAGFDVSRLLCGSLGILGIITEVSLKVLPQPRTEETFQLRLGAGDAIDVFNRWGSLPLPVSATAWADGVAWVRLSGATPAVKSARERIGGDAVDARTAAQFWDSLRHQTQPLFASPEIWRVSVPSTAPALDLPGDSLVEWGGALRWHTQPARTQAIAAGGTAVHWRGGADTDANRFHPLSPVVMEIHRRLKQRFDPQRIFNRNRLVRNL